MQPQGTVGEIFDHHEVFNEYRQRMIDLSGISDTEDAEFTFRAATMDSEAIGELVDIIHRLVEPGTKNTDHHLYTLRATVCDLRHIVW